MTWLLLFFKFGTEPRDIPIREEKRQQYEVVQRQPKFVWDERGDDR